MSFPFLRLLLLLGCGSLTIAAPPMWAKEVAKIAFIGPLTGGVSANGLGGRNSADLAVRLRNADPSSKYEYRLVVLDDECKPNIGVEVATRAPSDNSIVAGSRITARPWRWPPWTCITSSGCR